MISEQDIIQIFLSCGATPKQEGSTGGFLFGAFNFTYDDKYTVSTVEVLDSK